MRYSTALTLFATLAAATDFGKSCKDETIDLTTEVLTASCDTGDGKGTLQTSSISLNDCLAFSNNKIESKKGGHFGDVCNDCFSYRVPDPVYGPFGVTHVWMNCTCNGAPAETSVELDATWITNKFGTLVCARG
ncbi:hypothetical protein CTRI78_v010851 [Colletotrichum trifolii]|uniref:Cyanovirin-N domain-containing protein n=1 Tax=Colletotrichum trifolii TaxID=5466 RepID=A0A4R8QRF5_COLTR|nr:hypothetical protein CTRI78_v010851 [Colletotrichum trifolii]